jgi:N-acetylglutamate synthase-like GNAT family acetyltransferase
VSADFILRRATAADLGRIRQLIQRVQINPMGLDWRRFVLAIDASGNMLGCGQLKPHGQAVLELASIAVEPSCRHKGIARAIIEHLIAQAPRPLYLTCRSSLRGFYQEWGFRVMSEPEMPAYFRRLSRLGSLFMSLARYDESLLVMVLK